MSLVKKLVGIGDKQSGIFFQNEPVVDQLLRRLCDRRRPVAFVRIALGYRETRIVGLEPLFFRCREWNHRAVIVAELAFAEARFAQVPAGMGSGWRFQRWQMDAGDVAAVGVGLWDEHRVRRALRRRHLVGLDDSGL